MGSSTTLTKRTVDRAAVNDHKRRVLDEVYAPRLRELREALDLTRVELAQLLETSQNRASRLEHGDLERAQVDTLRRYGQATGGELHVQVKIDSRRNTIA
jgi:ribosome-binding protein aMBF1 (putative translation factor)